MNHILQIKHYLLFLPEFYIPQETYSQYLYIYMYLWVCVCFFVCVQYNYIVGREGIQMDTFNQISPPESTCNPLVIRTCYMIHPAFSFYLIIRKILSAVRIRKPLIVLTPNVLRYVVPLKAKIKNYFLELVHIILYI